MACIKTINNEVNRIIDTQVTIGKSYEKSDATVLSNRLNSLWEINVVNPVKLTTSKFTIAKDLDGISKVSDMIFGEQTKMETKLVEKPKEVILEQRAIVNNDFIKILNKYKANTIGVIELQNVKPDTYNKLQKDLTKSFDDLYTVRVNDNGTLYVSLTNADNNVFLEEANKTMNRGLSTSILTNAKVKASSVMLVEKFSKRFNSTIKIVSAEQAKEIFPGLRKTTAGFYMGNVSYLILERLKPTTTLHEAFSHPFVNYIKVNNNGLYQTLLEKARNNSQIEEYVERVYADYGVIEKEMEYITRALDLEYENQLKDVSLLKSIALFWERILNYIKGLFGIKTDISKFSTFKEVIKFALNSNEKLDLTNAKLMELSVMEDTYEDREENIEEELNDDAVQMFTDFRNEYSQINKKVADWVDTYKTAIREGRIILDDNQVLELDTFTARINALSKDLNKSNNTKQLIIKDKYLSAALTMLKDVASRNATLQEGSGEINQLLGNISAISQILEESLILSAFLKKRIGEVNRSNENLAKKQKEIIQYHSVMQALKSSLTSLNEFFINSTDVDSDNPVTKIISEINSNIDFSEKINDKVVVEHWAQEMHTAFDKLIGKKIDERISIEEKKIQRRVESLRNATTDADKDKIKKEIFDINQRIIKIAGWNPTIENIRKVIKGELGDSSYLKYMFDAAFNSEDMVVAGVATIIEKVYMSKLDSTQVKVNQMATLLDKFMDATGQSKGSKANLAEFFSPLIQKVEYKKLKAVQKTIDEIDETTNEVTRRIELQDEMVDVVEDQLIAKFDFYKLQEQLDLLLFDIKQARKTGTQLDVQKAIKEHSNFKRKYFTTALTEEFENRVMNSNILIEADLVGLTDSNGNPLSLTTNPDLALAAKAVLEPLYDAQSDFYKNTRTSDKPLTTAEINEFEEIKQKLRALSSLYIHGTSTLKTGVDLAIARSLIRSKNAKKGVYSYKPGEHSKARWEQRLAEINVTISEGIADGTITQEEGDEQLHNWHRLNSTVKVSPLFYTRKSTIINSIENAFTTLRGKYSFIDKFIDVTKDETKRNTLKAFWGEIYDPLNSLTDLEGIVNGTIANESLQKHIKDLIEGIESEQRNNSAVLKLTNKADLAKFDLITAGLSVTIGRGTIVPIRAFEISAEDIIDILGDPLNPPKQTSLLSLCKYMSYKSERSKKLGDYLNSVAGAFKDDIRDEKEIEKDLKEIQRFIFLNSEYAEILSIKIKNSLKDSTKTIEKNNEKLKELLEEELNGLLEDGLSAYAKNKAEQKGTTYEKEFDISEEEEEIFNSILEYNKEVGEYFGELSKMSKRIPTSYYIDTVKARKEAIVREFINTEIKDLIYRNVDPSDQSSIENADRNFERVRNGDYTFITALNNLVNQKFLNSEWYKQNHYKKREISNGTMVETDFPTPLWTESSPVNDEYKKLEPGYTYSKRSINEFLLDDNNQPTNIRLKRTDINDRFFGYMTPKERLDDGTESPYINQQYKSLERTNPRLVEVMNELADMYYEAQEMSGVKGLNLKFSMPRIESEGWEVVSQGGNQIARKIRKSITNKFTRTAQDTDYGYGYGDFEDRFTESIPVKFLADIPYEERSKDVFGNIVEFIAQAHLISGLNELYPSAKELHKILDKNTPAVTRENNIVYKTFGGAGKKFNDMIKVPLRGLENTRAEHVQHLIKTKILNVRRRELHIGNFSVTKTLDSFSSLTSTTTLAGIVRPNVVLNYLVGKVQTWLEVWSNGLMNREDYNNGIAKLYRYFATDFTSDYYKFGNKSLMGQLLIRYNTQSRDLFEIFGQELKRTPLKDIISSEVLFKTRRLTEFELSNSVVLALLSKMKVLDGDRQIPLLEAYETDANGNIKIKDGIKNIDGTDFTSADEDRMRIKAMSANLIIHGNYSKHNITKFDTTVLGPQISFFRKHLMAYYNKAWGEEQMHYGLGEVSEGYNRKAFKTLWNLAKNIFDSRARKDIWEDYKLDRKETNTYRKALIHNSIIALIYLLLAILDGDDDDDKKKDQTHDSFLVKSLIYQLMRLKSDLELNSLLPFFAGLDEAVGIYKSPSITMSKTGMAFFKLAGDIKDYAGYKLGMVEEEAVIMDRDYYMYKKGDLKLLKDFGKLTGITGSTFNPDKMVDQLENIKKTLYR